MIPTKLPQDPIGSGETVLVHLRDDVSNRTQTVVVAMLARANMFAYKTLFCLFLLGSILSVDSQDNQKFINEADIDSIGEITINDETFLTHIVPTGMLSKKIQKLRKPQLSDILNDHNNNDYKKFESSMEKGYTMKGLTFNIYDDNMREAAIALFRVMCRTNPETFKKLKEWAKQNINDHLFDYAVRLCALYGPHTYDFKWKASEPPFLVKPNFYVNGETIMKALKLKNNIESLNYQEAKVNQYYKTDKIVSINTNYSGWNLILEECKDKIDYFTEDISLNAYYYGLHLLHPFWMSNDELDEINPRQAEHYFFSHQQLLARYYLEEESLTQRNASINELCHNSFNSYLVYENGLPFPIRYNHQGDWNEDKARLKRIDIGIEEFISRGFFIMEDGNVNLTAENYVGIIAKIIRANYDEVETAKIIRSIFGYGKNGYPKDSYNPAPSLLHQPETSLRDPAYWYMIEYILCYFKLFEKSLEPQDLTQYETDSIVIIDANFTKLTTFFDYYQFVIDKVTAGSVNDFPYVSFTARQRRLQHLPITFDFSVVSKQQQNVTVRLFLGPPCLFENCWNERNQFYQLDVWSTTLDTGKSVIRWTPRMSNAVSSDAVFNKEERSTSTDIDNYNMFKFPENLLLPKGLEKGLNMTLFVMISPQIFTTKLHKEHYTKTVTNQMSGTSQ
ncbi:hemocyanin, copper containing domain-containing protein [Phthorimaea operculella]|nr:hemocyanin, copper containing domain-containing protein [Phthorimaea operculella]